MQTRATKKRNAVKRMEEAALQLVYVAEQLVGINDWVLRDKRSELLGAARSYANRLAVVRRLR